MFLTFLTGFFLVRNVTTTSGIKGLLSVPDILIVGGRGPTSTSDVEILTFNQIKTTTYNLTNYPVDISGEEIYVRSFFQIFL
jgi:hypothetical protein